LQRAWEQLNDEASGELAAEQAYLWHRFAQGLSSRNEPELLQSHELLTLTRHFLLKEASTLGALYALQSQLPFIASRLLDAVERFYATHAEHILPFCQHLQQHQELTGRALQYISMRSPAERQQAVDAAEREAQGLWNLLTGVHASYPAQ
jgi:pyrroloquinoline quinone (PQQ) biosynthesis protein C